MHLSLTAYPPGAAAIRGLLPATTPAVIGRNPQCALRIAHASVSDRHTRIEPHGDGIRVVDLGSRLGTSIGGAAVHEATLPRDGGWLRLGEVDCALEPVDAALAALLERREEERRSRALRHLVQLNRLGDLEAVLDHTLHAALDLADARRGFLVLRDGGDYRLQAAHAIAPGRADAAAPLRIDAMERALGQRMPVVFNRLAGLPAAPVPAGAVAALPLVDGRDVLGAVCVDHDGAEPVTEPDLERLRELADRAARCILAHGADRRLRVAPGASWRTVLGAANDD